MSTQNYPKSVCSSHIQLCICRQGDGLMGIMKFLLCFLLLVIGQANGEWTPEIIQQVIRRTTINLTMYVDKLPQPSKIFGYTICKRKRYWPKKITIGMYQTTMKFHRDLAPTPVFAYGTSKANAMFPGPAIETIRGVPTYITWENNLPLNHILPVDYTIASGMTSPNNGVPAVVHLHAGVVAPDSDGSPFAWYTANYKRKGRAWTKKTYTYPNVQHSGNLLYHDHALGLTRVNLLAGLIGPYLIRDPVLDTSLNLPKGNPYDLFLAIADRSFNIDGSIYMDSKGVNPDIHPVWRPGYYGDAITVNGKIWPYLRVKRRKYRFRILNASNARYFNLSFNNASIPFTVIGSDSSYLRAPVTTKSIVLAVAETFDVVVDFTNAAVSSIELVNTAAHPYENAAATPPGVLDSKVMKFILSAKTALDRSTIPMSLVTYEAANPNDATVTRYIAFYEYINNATGHTTHLLVNGKRLMDPPTETPKSGTTEVWHVINLTGDNHPLHIHLAHMQAVQSQLIDPLRLANFTSCMQNNSDPLVCNIAGVTAGQPMQVIPMYERTWKNVVKVSPGFMTSVVVKFKLVDSNDPYPFDPTKQPGYVYHCHILTHEDNEMIRPLVFVP